MTEISIIGELIKGGTTAGLLLAVGWFFFSRFFSLFERARVQAEEQLKAFTIEMQAERATHKHETDFLTAELTKLSSACMSLAKEITELRRDVRMDFSDEPGSPGRLPRAPRRGDSGT